MDRKVNLKLNDASIKRAEYYARKRRTGLSPMVESFFDELNDRESLSLPVTPLVEELSGIIHLDNSIDFKNERADFLLGKHSP